MSTPSPIYDRPGFLDRDPTAIAAEAALGANGAADVATWQDLYRQIFEFIEDETWPNQPEGPLATHWRGGQQSTYYLINAASLIKNLMQNASPGVNETIKQRLRTMFRPPNDHAYEEALVELEVGGFLARRTTPVLLEPLVPEELRSQANPPMSPDYGVRVPEGLVTVEVTVWHWEAYAAWDRMTTKIRTTLATRMGKRDVARHLRIDLPLGSPQEAAEYLCSREFFTQFCDNESGAFEITGDAVPRPISVAWRPVLHFDDQASIDWAAVAATGNLPFTTGDGVAGSFCLYLNPCINDDDRSAALESLRHSIDRKKRQRDPNLPHFVAIASTHPRIAVSGDQYANTWDVFGPLIVERLWPNRKYTWLSGILHHRANRVAPLDQVSYFLDYNPNPNARVPIPDSMMRALTGQADFHTMWQRPRRRPVAGGSVNGSGAPG